MHFMNNRYLFHIGVYCLVYVIAVPLQPILNKRNGMKHCLLFFSLFFSSLLLGAAPSDRVIRGIVTDKTTREPLIGATVQVANAPQIGTITDLDGQFMLLLPADTDPTLRFTYVGYDTLHLTASGESMLRVALLQHNELLDEVVISVGRFEQRQTDVTVSMELVKPEVIRSQAPTDLSATLQTLPGVEIVDKQPSIRGGGGWTYSVGSRCQVLMDEMTILNPKTGEVNWNNIPLENVSQVEVIKGASSVLYGSSALNGVINVRTQRPKTDPETKLSAYTGIYDNYTHYHHTGSRLPIYIGAEASHSRRSGNFDFTAAISAFKDEGYRQQSFNNRVRLGGNMTYHHPVERGVYMNAGLNTNYTASSYGDFFVWRNPKQPLQPSPLTNMGRKEHNFNIDPFFNYDDTEHGISHKVRARVYLTADNLTRPTATKSLRDILMASDVNVNTSAIMNYYNRYQQGDLSWIEPVLKPLLPVIPMLSDTNGLDWGQLLSKVDLGQLISGSLGLLDGVISGMETDNMTDLIGYGMDLLADDSPTRPELTYNGYLDYQFAKQWQSGVRLTTGINWNHITNTANITGKHETDNVALYMQYDHRLLDRLSLSAGVRFEYYRMDSHYKEANIRLGKWTCPVRPVLRAGLNWQIYEAGFLRASFGQGYRNPSITEKFARKDIGGVGVYPNENVAAESGFNAELGYKQLYQWKRWSGYVDVAGFYTQYKDMIEYQFGLFDNSNFRMINSLGDAVSMIQSMLRREAGAGLGIGAQFVNVNRARIYGAEISTAGKVDIRKDMVFSYMLGYTFTQPEDMDNDERVEREKTYTDPLQMKNKSNDSKYLKYRNRHSFKASLDYRVCWFSIGTNLGYRSKLLAVDYLLVDEREKEQADLMDYVRQFIFGTKDGETLASYWSKHNKGVFTMDVRCAFRYKEHVELQFMINNLLNTEYSYRPMAIAAPRTYVVRLNYTF